MSAIIIDYDIVMKDGADPSTSTASGNLNGDRYSVIMPVTRHNRRRIRHAVNGTGK